jgi:hypothetical protein
MELTLKFGERIRRAACVLVLLAASTAAMASEYHGLVTFGGLPVPGATVTVTQGGKKYVTVTDTQGFYSFPTLADGPATVEVEMTGFAPIKEDVTIAPDASLGKLELKLMTLDQMRADLKPVLSAPFTAAQTRSEVKVTGAPPPRPKPDANAAASATPPPPEDVAQRAQDGLLVNGSVNNAATSQFTLGPRFGNTASGRSLYNFSLYLRVDNSALDAKQYSITGFDSSKPQTDQITGGFSVQGPIKIPHLLHNGPNTFINYQRVRNSVATTTPGLVPTPAEIGGNLSALTQPIYAPATGLSTACLNQGVTPGAPFAGNIIPTQCISTSAQALLALYPGPLPGLAANLGYNYQIPIVTDTHSDAVSSNVNKTIGRKNQIAGDFAALSTRTSYANLFGFEDKTRALGLRTNVNWSHTLNAHLHTNLSYQYSRQSNRLTPYWANRTNLSQQAGIAGNDQDPTYWGPPTLSFSSGLASLSDGQSSFTRNQTSAYSAIVRWNRAPHNITAGVDFRRQEFNYLSQQNARGTFSFTGAATASASVPGSGSDLADFLLGTPDASAIGFGNADKYLRQSVYDAYATDDWRVTPQLTINAGVRWEYGAPVTEIKNRLVNLDVANDFATVQPVLATSPKGSVTGQSLPSSLMRPDRTGVQPRIGVSWRPLPGSSLIVSGGYGITYDTSLYQGIALAMAQQSPLPGFKSQTVNNSATCPLSLTNGFNVCPASFTFGVDPNYRVGYLQTWNLKLQRDLPESLQMVVTYLGNKGTRGAQLFLPNTNPAGAVNPCPSCPTGFEYLASGGDSTRESGQIQLRRRLTSGFTASVLYTYSKSLDDDSALGGQGAATSGGASIAQDWRNLNAERGLSTFDQRHLVNIQAQYTTGMGKGGGTLLTGWRGHVYKEWTVQTQINYGTGLPQTPIDSATVVAGYASTVRPNVTGANLYAGTNGHYLNAAAYATPLPGQWGDARRDSITGPSQLTLNAALLRTFRLPRKLNLDLSISANNGINHVTYSSWIANHNSAQFGLPAAANAMRSVLTSLRLRF